jgi:hypothetical protein
MTEHAAAKGFRPPAPEPSDFPAGAWIRANAVGLSITFALFALVGGAIEALGADHDSAVRNLPAITAMAIGGMIFARLRRRALGDTGSPWQPLAVGAGIAAGFAVGSVAVPLDFVISILVAGLFGGAVQLRQLRRRLAATRRLFLVAAGGWLIGAVAAIATVILVADVIIDGLLGHGDVLSSVPGFVAVLAFVGFVSGAVGGAIEGATLRRRAAGHPAGS